MGIELIILGIGLVGLIVFANILALRGRAAEQGLFRLLLLLANLPVFLIGLLLITNIGDMVEESLAEAGLPIENMDNIGAILAIMGLWGMIVCLGPVRRLLARVMPLDPASAVHTLALVMAGYLVGQSVLSLSQGDISGLVEMAEPASVSFFVVSELLFAVVAMFGVGFLVRRSGRDLASRLGLQPIQRRHVLVAAALIPTLVIAQGLAGVAWALLNPEQAEVLENLNGLLLQDVDTLWEWIALALAAGIGEELLFRGALQPAFGLLPTAALFALVHVQYGFTPIMLFILLLAVLLGLVRRYYGTTTAIIIHVGYDLALGILALLATYLGDFAGS